MAKKKSTKKTAKKAAKRKAVTKNSKPRLKPSFSPFEIACIAKHFLPPIELPKEWENVSGVDLGHTIGCPTRPFNGVQQRQLDNADFRSAWEVICDEAAFRARTLLNAAAGTDLRKSAFDRFLAQAAIKDQELLKEVLDKWLDVFAKKSKGQAKVALDQCLKWILPKVSAKNRRVYYNVFLEIYPESASSSLDAGKFTHVASLIVEFGEEIRAEATRLLQSRAGKRGAQRKAKKRGNGFS
jgi:hypothetical protein